MDHFNSQIPRNTFIWLLSSLTFLLIPHFIRYPILLIPLLLICFFWRIMIFKQRFSTPSKWIKILLVSFGFGTVMLLPYPWLSLETTVAVLLVAALLKLLEMQTRRDLLILIYLGYFVIVTQLLFDQTLISALYMLTGILLITACLIALMTKQQGLNWLYPLKYSAQMMCLSLPIMVFSFLMFPRLDPFWSVPLPNGKGKTGISEQMSPGLISELAQSDALAFRVNFTGEIPNNADLYWRGPTLSHFDGTTWTLNKAFHESSESIQQTDAGLQSVQYQVIMEPSYNFWLFPLVGVIQSDKNLDYYSDNSVKTLHPITQKMAFQFTSSIHNKRALELDEWQQRQALDLPVKLNPKTISLAKKLRAESPSDIDYLRKIQAFFLDQPFYYTLNPPRYDGDSIDNFLFSGRQGFCEHYASSYVVLMRAAGIPARVVTGYQGGEVNRFEDYLAVRQMDAHAWAEVWLPKIGWKRVDPTAFIAPERIRLGSQESLQQEDFYLAQSALSTRHLSSFAWYQYVEQRYGQINYLWTKSVLSYTGDKQEQILASLLGEFDWRKMAGFMGGILLCFFILLYGFLNFQGRGRAGGKVEKQYARFLKKLSKKGVIKPHAQGPQDFLQTIEKNYPAYYPQAKSIIGLYIKLSYMPIRSSALYDRQLIELRQHVSYFGA